MLLVVEPERGPAAPSSVLRTKASSMARVVVVVVEGLGNGGVVLVAGVSRVVRLLVVEAVLGRSPPSLRISSKPGMWTV